jgi:hypothetical protein
MVERAEGGERRSAPLLLVASSGLGHVNRGFETFALVRRVAA